MKKVFIGSPVAALPKARFLQKLLGEIGAVATCWPDAFPVGEYTMERLLNATRDFDAAVFIYGADDEIMHILRAYC